MSVTSTISRKTGLTNERLLFLDSLRAIAIIMVVGVHTGSYCIPLSENQQAIISFIVHTVSVPVFFLVDGFLFARSSTYSSHHNYFNNVKKSTNRLLLPWLIFTFTYTITRYGLELNGLTKETLIVGHSFQEVLISAYGSVYSGQMYFLASLFLIRLCSPIFRRFVLLESFTIMVALFALYFSIYKVGISYISPYLIIEGGQEPVLHALWGIQFYLVGIILYKSSVIIDLKKLCIPSLLLFMAVLLLRNELWDIGPVLTQYSYLIALFLLFMIIGDRMSFLNIIGKNTMGIYLLHAPVILKVVSLASNKIISIPILSFTVILIGTLIISLLIVIFTRTIPYGGVLFGEGAKKLTILQR